jgi:hypothetical protein
MDTHNATLCKVKNCRFNKFHLTKRHQCGMCLEYGHGQNECKDHQLKSDLNVYFNDIIGENLYCSISDCIDPNTHLTRGHTCRFCYNKHLHKKKCPLNLTENNSISDNKTDYNIDVNYIASKYNLQIGECIRLYGELGSSWYFRINKNTLQTEFIMIHSDSWGQYGDDFSDRYRLNAFIYDYKLIFIDSLIHI